MSNLFTQAELRMLAGLVANYRRSLIASLDRTDLTDAGRAQYLSDDAAAEILEVKLAHLQMPMEALPCDE